MSRLVVEARGPYATVRLSLSCTRRPRVPRDPCTGFTSRPEARQRTANRHPAPPSQRDSPDTHTQSTRHADPTDRDAGDIPTSSAHRHLLDSPLPTITNSWPMH